MLMRVEPHDLQAICTDCGTTLAELSRDTGLREEVLLAFAAGRIGLSATARLRIVAALHAHAPRDGQLTTSLPVPDEVSRDLAMGVGTHVVTVAAYNRILREIEDEQATTHKETDRRSVEEKAYEV